MSRRPAVTGLLNIYDVPCKYAQVLSKLVVSSERLVARRPWGWSVIWSIYTFEITHLTSLTPRNLLAAGRKVAPGRDIRLAVEVGDHTAVEVV